jgi:hypothetical protein
MCPGHSGIFIVVQLSRCQVLLFFPYSFLCCGSVYIGLQEHIALFGSDGSDCINYQLLRLKPCPKMTEPLRLLELRPCLIEGGSREQELLKLPVLSQVHRRSARYPRAYIRLHRLNNPPVREAVTLPNCSQRAIQIPLGYLLCPEQRRPLNALLTGIPSRLDPKWSTARNMVNYIVLKPMI